MDYKKFAKQLRNQAGSYALFYGAPRGDLEKAADVIEELAAKMEPSSTPPDPGGTAGNGRGAGVDYPNAWKRRFLHLDAG